MTLHDDLVGLDASFSPVLVLYPSPNIRYVEVPFLGHDAAGQHASPLPLHYLLNGHNRFGRKRAEGYCIGVGSIQVGRGLHSTVCLGAVAPLSRANRTQVHAQYVPCPAA